MPIFTLIERINMHKNRPWLRFIEGPNGNTGAAPAAPEPADPSDAGEQSPPDTAPSTDEGQSDGENPDARGSKQAVLADLARERDKRQSLESERDELKAKVEEFERAQMSEAEKVEADRKDLEQKYTDAQAKIAEHERKTSLAEPPAHPIDEGWTSRRRVELDVLYDGDDDDEPRIRNPPESPPHPASP